MHVVDNYDEKKGRAVANGSSENKTKKFDGASPDGAIQETTVTKPQEIYDPSKESRLTRLGLNANSFRKAPGTTAGSAVEGNADAEADMQHSSLQQNLKDRHLKMIAVGGSIGTGLFIGTGAALADGGPGGVLIAWILMGAMLYYTCQAIGEMAILYPVTGGFYTLVGKFTDDSWAFAMGWNYLLQWAVTLPLELTAAGFTVGYWDTEGKLNIGVYITIFAAVIIFINLFGTLGFAEEEFWSSILKLLVVAMFVFSSIIFICGGGPKSGDFGSYFGARYWRNPGAFPNGFKGVCAVFVTAAFSFAGTELVGMAVVEHPNPRRVMPGALKSTFYRITFVYIISLLLIGMTIRSDDPRLIGGSYDANTSPFVLTFVNAGVAGLPDLVNATITISVLSIGMACVYAGSRTLHALAEQGYAPRCFRRVDKAGRPTWAVVAILAFWPIAYINIAADVGTQVFDWLLALSGLATIFSWLSINVAHIRFRQAWKAQGHSLDELPYRATGGIYGSYFAAGLLVLVLIAQFYVALFPIGGVASASERAQGFFLSYLAAPLVLAFYLGAVMWKRTRPKKLTEIDLVSGRKVWTTAEENIEYRRLKFQGPWYKKILIWLFR